MRTIITVIYLLIGIVSISQTVSIENEGENIDSLLVNYYLDVNYSHDTSIVVYDKRCSYYQDTLDIAIKITKSDYTYEMYLCYCYSSKSIIEYKQFINTDAMGLNVFKDGTFVENNPEKLEVFFGHPSIFSIGCSRKYNELFYLNY